MFYKTVSAMWGIMDAIKESKSHYTISNKSKCGAENSQIKFRSSDSLITLS